MFYKNVYLLGCSKNKILEYGSASLFDIKQLSQKWFLLSSNRHVIARLHINKQFRIDAKGCFREIERPQPVKAEVFSYC